VFADGDLRDRVKIVESTWRSIVTKELQTESELMQVRAEMQSKLQSELSREIQERDEIQVKLES
jgi:hypothetical protein